MTDERVVELLQELVVWTRFSARDQLDTLLRATLADSRHQQAYEATDGNRTQQQVGEQAGLDQTTVSELWARWRRIGIVRDAGRRPAHLVSLADLGWDLAGGRRATRRPTRAGGTDE